VLGFEIPKDVLTGHLIRNEFNIDKTVDQILNSKSGKLCLILLEFHYFIFYIFYNVGDTKGKEYQGTEDNSSRPTVVIASSSKNKDSIVVGFGNTSISGIFIY
jgi:hypothetical protein